MDIQLQMEGTQMQGLYKKLWEKYNKLKDAQNTELDRINSEQEQKFKDYVYAADDVIECLKRANDKLFEDDNELRKEVASLRAAKDQVYEEYQNLLFEEKQKNRELSLEIERLKSSLKEQQSYSARSNENEGRLQSSRSSFRMTRKRARVSREIDMGIVSPSVCRELELPAVRDTLAESPRNTVSNLDAQQPGCDGRHSNKTDPFKCLVECLIGMEVSVNQSEGICVCVVHQSSGYSFSLTWMNKATDDEPGWVYRVSSLGTLVKVAPEWMREMIMFTTSMCPVFFERVYRIIKHC